MFCAKFGDENENVKSSLHICNKDNQGNNEDKFQREKLTWAFKKR